ncbi:hypothetical protein SAMN05421505_11289 [Sinosporangium album]|uniref:Uncharacterized protein n=1 Tax=Sinosporangium album TaxID=504805 RepID=A0A1G8ABI2_9ACTN|nr:hypothetical protein [Sinosporangium album]SDH18223.1 hypothetical protein SAMN05421505_11289 [Sinosporangium album]
MPHEVTDDCHAIHCYVHDEDEPTPQGAHDVCLECNHVYPTRADLIRAYQENGVARGPRGEMWICPYCSHDL